MQELWEHFETWLRNHWPEGLKALNPPASAQDIEALEQALGLTLPQDFVACLRLHNGQDSTAGGLFDGAEFLSTHAILGQWKIWKDLLDSGDFAGISSEPAAGIRNDWWNPKWIPFTHNGGGDHLCLDLAPTPEGQSGQIITMWHDMGNRERLAESFQAWLAHYIQDVQAGRYVYSDDFGGLVDVDSL
ncbi:MAG: SMI1/KNR4 family protein [Rhodocyclales bacterium]|nr:SMI1/KNR4 family protein [Rhodocyclales bacterium]